MENRIYDGDKLKNVRRSYLLTRHVNLAVAKGFNIAKKFSVLFHCLIRQLKMRGVNGFLLNSQRTEKFSCYQDNIH
jgi:hypothetical protein